MGSDVFSRLAALVPANGVAAQVTRPGEHWTPAKKVIGPHEAWQDLPLPVLPTPKTFPYPEMIGARVCRLVVLGYGGTGSGGAKWVVRCDCGMYGHQKMKYLRSENARRRAKCPQCDYLDYITGRQDKP